MVIILTLAIGDRVVKNVTRLLGRVGFYASQGPLRKHALSKPSKVFMDPEKISQLAHKKPLEPIPISPVDRKALEDVLQQAKEGKKFSAY